MLEIVYNTLDIIFMPLFNIIKALAPGTYALYAVLIISLLYLLCINLIIRLVTNREEKEKLKKEIKGIKDKIIELKGGGVKNIIRNFRNKEARKKIAAKRKNNKPLIKFEYKKLGKLQRKYSWNFVYKPLLYYIFTIPYLLRWGRLKFQGPIITEPITLGALGISLIFIIAFSPVVKRIMGTN